MPAGQPLVNEIWVERSTGTFYRVVRVDNDPRRPMVELTSMGERSLPFLMPQADFMRQCDHVSGDVPPQGLTPGRLYITTEPEYVGPMPPQPDFVLNIPEAGPGLQDLMNLASEGLVSNASIIAAFGLEPETVNLRTGMGEAPAFRFNVEGINPMAHPNVNHSLLAALIKSASGFTYQEFTQALSPAYLVAYQAHLQATTEAIAAGKVSLTPPENPSFWERLEDDDA